MKKVMMSLTMFALVSPFIVSTAFASTGKQFTCEITGTSNGQSVWIGQEIIVARSARLAELIVANKNLEFIDGNLSLPLTPEIVANVTDVVCK